MPIGAYAEAIGGELVLIAAVIAPDGSRHLRASAKGPVRLPEELGMRVAHELLSRGAGSILEASR